MITRIELTNFMSHRHTVIEPAAGLTVLVGPNNVGKSAVVSALQILSQNESSSYVMRHGERECSVQVHTDDDHVVEWKRKTSPSYVIDGQAFDRLGRSGIPDELHQALRLPRVDSGSDNDFDVHFGTQKSPVFLLDSSPANAARFFASSSDAIRLVAMQKRHKEKLTEAKGEKGRLEKESQELSAKLEILAPVVEVEQRLKESEQAYAELIQFETWIDEAEWHARSLQAQGVAASECRERGATLAPLKPLPELLDLSPLERLLAEAAGLAHQSAVASSRFAALRLLAPLPDLPPTESLAALIGSFERAQSGMEREEAQNRLFLRLSNPPELDDSRGLERLTDCLIRSIRELQASQERASALRLAAEPPKLADEDSLRILVASLTEYELSYGRWQESQSALRSISPLPPEEDITGLAKTIYELDVKANDAQLRRKELAAAESALGQAREDLHTESEGAQCPICGGPLDLERVVDLATPRQGGHAHE